MFERRDFLKAIGGSMLLNAGRVDAYLTPTNTSIEQTNKRISLSQWAFHRSIFGSSRDNYQQFIKTLNSQPDYVLKGSMDSKDIVVVARNLGIKHVDLVNLFFFGHAKDLEWLRDFRLRANDNDVQFQVLMCDEVGFLGASNKNKRLQSIENHLPWLEAAATLGCKQLRVNPYGDGTYLQQLEHCAESLVKLATLAEKNQIELLVENHGHPGSNGAWLAMLIEQAKHNNLGVFTDLDNFFMGGWDLIPERRYDRVQGLLDLAPYTRGVSVKSYDFDRHGYETTLDFGAYFRIFQQAEFDGFYSAEYEGTRLSEIDGTVATIALARDVISKVYR